MGDRPTKAGARGGRRLLLLATLLVAGAPRQLNPLTSRQRRMLLDLISSRPGSSVTELMVHVPFQWGSMSYHLRRLQEAGLVHVVDDPSDGRRKRIYPVMAGAAGLPDPPPRAPGVKGLSLEIARTIVSRPGLSFTELGAAVETSPRNVHYHLKRLIEHGLVTSSSSHRYRDLRPTPRLVALLDPREEPPEDPGTP